MSNLATIQTGSSQLPVLINHRTDIESVLPNHITFEQFSKAVSMAVMQNSDLMDADQKTLFNSVMQCANDGLIPDNKEAALIPYKKKVSYLPMVGGVLKRIRQSGQVKSIIAKPVFENDSFDYWFDEDGEHIKFKPVLSGEKGGLKLVFAAARLISNELIVEVLSKTEVDKIRKESKASYAGNPWEKWYERMAVKTAIHRISKHLPNASEILDMALRGIETNSVQPSVVSPIAEEFYPQDQFDKNFPSWADMIKSKKKTPTQMIEFLSKKTKLSEQQIQLLENVEID